MKTSKFLMSSLVTMLVLFATHLFSGCSKSPEPISLMGQSYSDEALNYFGKTLARAMYSEPNLRAFLKGEALKQIDGDYDVFYQSNKNKMIIGSKTLHEILLAYSDNSEKLEELINNNLDLNIKVPIVDGTSAEKWDTDNYVPLVAIRDRAITTSTSDLFTVYNGLGETNKIPASYKKAPKQVTVVVELSERIHIENKETIERDVAAGINKYKNSQATPALPSTNQSSSSNARILAGERDLYPDVRQRLRSITIKSNAWERVTQDQDWGDGFIELHAKFIYLANTTDNQFSTQEAPITGRISEYIPCERGETSVTQVFRPDEAFGANFDLAKWDKNKSGDTWKIYLYEKDGGYEVKSTVGFSTKFEAGITDPVTGTVTHEISSSTEVTRQDQDDFLGETFIYYDEPLRTDYEGLPDIKFSMGLATDQYFLGSVKSCTPRGPR